MESSHLLYHRNGFSVRRRHGVGAGQSVQNLKVVRMGLARAFECRHFRGKVRGNLCHLRRGDRHARENENQQHPVYFLQFRLPVPRSNRYLSVATRSTPRLNTRTGVAASIIPADLNRLPESATTNTPVVARIASNPTLIQNASRLKNAKYR